MNEPPKPSCPNCSLMICSCADEIKQPPVIESKRLAININGIRQRKIEMAKAKLPDLSRFPLKSVF